MSVTTVVPFSFVNLPKVSRADSNLLMSLRSLWSRGGFSDRFIQGLGQTVEQVVGAPCTIEVERVFTSPAKAHLSGCPPIGAYLLIGMTPLPHKICVELDLYLVHNIIDRLLGGEGEPLGMIGALSEVEEGVFSYFVLKLLAHVYEKEGQGTKLHFRLEDLSSSWHRWEKTVNSGTFVVIVLSIGLGARRGFCKLMLPAPLVQKGLVDAFRQDDPLCPRPAGTDFVERFGWVETRVWAELGRTSLKGSEVKGLARGDVVFFDKTGASWQEGRPAGQVMLRVGRGAQGLPARIVSVGKTVEVKIL